MTNCVYVLVPRTCDYNRNYVTLYNKRGFIDVLKILEWGEESSWITWVGLNLIINVLMKGGRGEGHGMALCDFLVRHEQKSTNSDTDERPNK